MANRTKHPYTDDPREIERWRIKQSEGIVTSDSHSADSTIHFTMGSISITESQISDLKAYSLSSHLHSGIYEPADTAIQLTITAYASHAADATIHYSKTEGEYHINLLDSHVLTIGTDDHTLHLLLGGRSGGQTISDNITIAPSTGVALTIDKVAGAASIAGDTYLILDSAGTTGLLGLNYYASDNVMIGVGGGNVGVGSIATLTEKFEVNGNMFLRDNDQMIFGTGKDASIYYNGSDLIINPDLVGSGRAYISGEAVVSGNLTIGAGAAGIDYVITVNGETNNLTMTYMEDEDRFDISSDITVKTYERHLDIDVSHAGSGSSAPSYTETGTSGGWTYNADAENSKISFEVPNDWDGTSDVKLGIYWYPLTAMADTETVKFDATYRVKAPNASVAIDSGSTTLATVTYTQSGAGTAKDYIYSEITIAYNDATNPLVKDSECFIQFDRDMTGDTFGGDATIVIWHGKINSIGMPRN